MPGKLAEEKSKGKVVRGWEKGEGWWKRVYVVKKPRLGGEAKQINSIVKNYYDAGSR